MLREGPRRVADACEAGDWLHVDVYLAKPLDYRALVFAGSVFEPAIMEWMRRRGGRVVGVGGGSMAPTSPCATATTTTPAWRC